MGEVLDVPLDGGGELDLLLVCANITDLGSELVESPLNMLPSLRLERRCELHGVERRTR